MDDVLKQAVYAAVADKVLETLDGDARNKILSEGIARALDSYHLQATVQKIVNARAEEIANAVIETGKYDDQIKLAILDGMNMVVEVLPIATRDTITDALTGKSSQLGNAIRKRYGEAKK